MPIPKRAFRLSVASWLGMTAAACPAVAQAAAPEGEWQGTYICAQGITAVHVSVARSAEAQLKALFHFAALPSNPAVPEGCFTMRGDVDANGTVTLSPVKWLKRPDGYVMVGIEATMTQDGLEMNGRVTTVPGLCTTIALHRAPDDTPMGACEDRAKPVALAR